MSATSYWLSTSRLPVSSGCPSPGRSRPRRVQQVGHGQRRVAAIAGRGVRPRSVVERPVRGCDRRLGVRGGRVHLGDQAPVLRVNGGHIQGDADPCPRAIARTTGTARPCANNRRMRHPQRRARVVQTGRVFAGVMSQKGAAPRLVHRDPALDPVTQAGGRPPRCSRQMRRRWPDCPSRPGVLERLRQIPVVQRCPRLDASFQQRVDQPVVPIQPGALTRRSAAAGSRGQAIEKRYAFRPSRA